MKALDERSAEAFVLLHHAALRYILDALEDKPDADAVFNAAVRKAKGIVIGLALVPPAAGKEPDVDT